MIELLNKLDESDKARERKIKLDIQLVQKRYIEMDGHLQNVESGMRDMSIEQTESSRVI